MRIFALASLFLAGSVLAAPGHWYEPAEPGYGVQINQDGGFGYAVTFYLYRTDGSTAFLIGAETCEEFPCVVALLEPTADFMGGNLDVGNALGELEIGVFDGEVLPIRFDLRVWLGEYCENISVGGIIFRQCAGQRNLRLLTE